MCLNPCLKLKKKKKSAIGREDSEIGMDGIGESFRTRIF